MTGGAWLLPQNNLVAPVVSIEAVILSVAKDLVPKGVLGLQSMTSLAPLCQSFELRDTTTVVRLAKNKCRRGTRPACPTKLL